MPEAVASLQEATRLEPTNGEAHYQLGLALARAGRKEDAAAALQKGRELVAADDRNQQAALNVAEGRAALQNGDLEQAAAKFRRALELRPDAVDAKRDLEAVIQKQQQASVMAGGAEARAATTTGERRLPSGRSAAGRRARGLHPGRKVRRGRASAHAYVNERRRPPGAGTRLATAGSVSRRSASAIQALAKSLELDVRNAEAHKILGRSLMVIGRFDAAQIEFEQGIRYKPDSAEMHYNLGKLLSIQDNWEPARKAFEAALRIDPSYVEAIDALGLALEALGDDAGAVATYEKAIALNDERHGQFTSAYVNLSAFYNRTANPDKALEYAKKALEIDPRSDGALFQKARADERQGRLDDAVDALEPRDRDQPARICVLLRACRACTGVWAGWTRARRRSSRSSAWIGKATSSTRCAVGAAAAAPPAASEPRE